MSPLERERRARGLTQEALGRSAGVPAPIISRYERGLRPCSYAKSAHKLAAALGVPYEALWGSDV